MNSEEKLGIVICGGGNGSHASVAHIGSTNKYRVNVYTRKPQEWSN